LSRFFLSFGVAQVEVGLVVGVVAGLDRAAALHLGVELGAEEHRGVGDPQPDQGRR